MERITELVDRHGLSKCLTWAVEQHETLTVVVITLEPRTSMDDTRLRDLSKELSLLDGIDRVWVSIPEQDSG